MIFFRTLIFSIGTMSAMSVWWLVKEPAAHLISPVQKSVKTVPDSFPVPRFEHQLFYIQRSVNTNTIMYEVNLRPDGKPNPQMPVKIYWQCYAEQNQKEDLTIIQKKYAYGLNATLVNAEKQSYLLTFVSYRKKNLYLIRSEHDHKYHVYTYINGRLSQLDRVYVHIVGGSFWVPNIEYLDISGHDLTGKHKTSERFIP